MIDLFEKYEKLLSPTDSIHYFTFVITSDRISKLIVSPTRIFQSHRTCELN